MNSSRKLFRTAVREGGDPIWAISSRRELPPLKASKICRKLGPRLREGDGFEVNKIIPDTSARKREPILSIRICAAGNCGKNRAAPAPKYQHRPPSWSRADCG